MLKGPLQTIQEMGVEPRTAVPDKRLAHQSKSPSLEPLVDASHLTNLLTSKFAPPPSQ